MSYQYERDNFISRVAAWGIDANTARLILRHAQTYQRLSERECNGDDWQIGALVKCPASIGKHAVRVGWCALCSVTDASLGHDRVTRSSVRMDQIEARIRAICESGVTRSVQPEFQGDPRGYTVKLVFLGVTSIGVPTRSR